MTDRRNGPWADPALAIRLRTLWEVDGLTASQCAERLGVSRASVISKTHRMGLSRRPSPVKPRLHPLRQGGRRNAAGQLVGSTLPPLESERR